MVSLFLLTWRDEVAVVIRTYRTCRWCRAFQLCGICQPSRTVIDADGTIFSDQRCVTRDAPLPLNTRTRSPT